MNNPFIELPEIQQQQLRQNLFCKDGDSFSLSKFITMYLLYLPIDSRKMVLKSRSLY